MDKYSMKNIEINHGGSAIDVKDYIPKTSTEIPAVFITKEEDLIKDAEETTNVNVNHPNHYNSGKIEVIEYIEDQNLGFCLGNAIKYISRAGKKDPKKEIEDLRKAIWYIERRILEVEKDLCS